MSTQTGVTHNIMSMHYRELVYRQYRTGHYLNLDPGHELKLRRPFLRRIFRRYVPINSNARILDLGCGCGTILQVLKEMGIADAQGVETSPECVAIAQRANFKVLQSDVVSFLRQANSQKWHVIIAFDLLEHLTKDEIVNVLALIREHLTPDGYLVMHVPNGESIFGTRVFSNDITHETIFTRNSLHQLLIPLGYGEIRCFEDVPIVHGPKSALRWLGWMVVRALAHIPLVLETGSLGSYILTQTMLVTARVAAPDREYRRSRV